MADTELTAHHFVGGERSLAGSREFRAVNPATGERLEPIYFDATDIEIDQAISLAADAHETLKSISREVRAAFLDEIAQQILDLGDALIDRTSQETGLPSTRLMGERGRTVGQLRLFADLVRDGWYVGARIDRGDPARQPLPKPDVRRMQLPLGPVAIFGASNFPLAFSVAGGDTASALAAGCPVVVKAHPHHPGASEMVASAIARAIHRTGLPEGTFSLVQGASHVVGMALVRHPLTAAVGFTGSLGAGRAIFDAASSRSKPIPVFAEMGSLNPVFLLPEAVAQRGPALAEGLTGSVTLGVGQFCTKPGLVFVVDTPGVEDFLSDLASRIGGGHEGTLLHAGIRRGFEEGVSRLKSIPGVELRARSSADPVAPCGALPTLMVTTGSALRAHGELQEE
ncbi:MAG: aldehyde dehydrogenase (NADP(+)), partial [Acidobacteriota bacterium]